MPRGIYNMARDYVRGNKPRKNTKAKTLPWKPLFTLLITTSFFGGLWFLAKQPNNQAEPKPMPQPIAIIPQLDQLFRQTGLIQENDNKTDKGNFDFYNLLPDSQIKPQEVEAYKSTPKEPNKNMNTRLQAGSFRNLRGAEHMRAKLILLHLPNVVTEKTTSRSGSIWYRVRLGPFTNRSMLNKAEDILVQNNISPLRIKRD